MNWLEQVEEGSQLNSVDEIAAAVNQLLRTVQQELAYQLNWMNLISLLNLF